MNRWASKKKRWQDKKSREGNRRKGGHSRSRVGDSAASSPDTHYIKKQTNAPYKSFYAPQVFSVIKNPEETIKFFTALADEMRSKEIGIRFFIDSSRVEDVTADALIYLIAILQNTTYNKTKRYSFSGNYPLNERARKTYEESGFNHYVIANMKALPESTEKMRIISGNNNSPEDAKKLCEFVMKNQKKNRVEVVPLQKVLIELMSNVYHHAYEKLPFMARKWYLYAEHSDDRIKCIFVDTGRGIAATARKNYLEKVTEKFSDKEDARIIKSVFDGDFRTATNETFRGNGLFSVRQNVRAEIFDSFEVISGKGRCVIEKGTDELNTESYSRPLFGTLYRFTLR